MEPSEKLKYKLKNDLVDKNNRLEEINENRKRLLKIFLLHKYGKVNLAILGLFLKFKDVLDYLYAQFVNIALKISSVIKPTKITVIEVEPIQLVDSGVDTADFVTDTNAIPNTADFTDNFIKLSTEVPFVSNYLAGALIEENFPGLMLHLADHFSFRNAQFKQMLLTLESDKNFDSKQEITASFKADLNDVAHEWTALMSKACDPAAFKIALEKYLDKIEKEVNFILDANDKPAIYDLLLEKRTYIFSDSIKARSRVNMPEGDAVMRNNIQIMRAELASKLFS